MRVLERFLLAHIDRALDDGKPLVGLIRLLVRRNERLRRYYEAMLALELELRFSDDVPVGQPSVVLSEKVSSVSRMRRRLFVMGTTVAVCALIAIVLVFRPVKNTLPIILPAPPDAHVTSSDDTFREALVAFVPLEQFDGTTPAESLINFSERPLELTSKFLAPIGFVVAKNSPVETSGAN